MASKNPKQGRFVNSIDGRYVDATYAMAHPRTTQWRSAHEESANVRLERWLRNSKIQGVTVEYIGTSVYPAWVVTLKNAFGDADLKIYGIPHYGEGDIFDNFLHLGDHDDPDPVTLDECIHEGLDHFEELFERLGRNEKLKLWRSGAKKGENES